MIYILTGPVRTGKTTALLYWSDKRSSTTKGMLCPDDASGKRYFLNIGSQQRFPLETESSTTDEDLLIKIGPFCFLKQAFTMANTMLISAAKKKDYKHLIIDELGKLELKNTGLHNAAKILIPQHEFNNHSHLILVVRDTLLDAIISHYKITRFSALTKETLAIIAS